MEIKRLKNAKFGTKELHVVVTGWAFYVKGKGYVAYSHDRDEFGDGMEYVKELGA